MNGGHMTDVTWGEGQVGSWSGVKVAGLAVMDVQHGQQQALGQVQRSAQQNGVQQRLLIRMAHHTSQHGTPLQLVKNLRNACTLLKIRSLSYCIFACMSASELVLAMTAGYLQIAALLHCWQATSRLYCLCLQDPLWTRLQTCSHHVPMHVPLPLGVAFRDHGIS